MFGWTRPKTHQRGSTLTVVSREREEAKERRGNPTAETGQRLTLSRRRRHFRAREQSAHVRLRFFQIAQRSAGARRVGPALRSWPRGWSSRPTIIAVPRAAAAERRGSHRSSMIRCAFMSSRASPPPASASASCCLTTPHRRPQLRLEGATRREGERHYGVPLGRRPHRIRGT